MAHITLWQYSNTMNNKEIWWGNIAFYLQLCENIKSNTWFFDEYWWDIELVLYSSLCQISRDVTSFVWHKKAHLYKRREDGQHYHFHIGGPGNGRQQWWRWEIFLSGWNALLTLTFLQSLLSILSLSLLSLQAGALRRLSPGTELSWAISLKTLETLLSNQPFM